MNIFPPDFFYRKEGGGKGGRGRREGEGGGKGGPKDGLLKL